MTDRMSEVPDYTNMSLALSEALREAGINEVIVGKRRSLLLLMETMRTVRNRMTGENASWYHFGSQSEGTTTKGLNSDVDTVCCNNDFNVIADWHEWKPGVSNYLMVYNETTSPGYCMLQRLRDDAPLPETDIIDQCHFKDLQGRVLLKNNQLSIEGIERHGPAQSYAAEAGRSSGDWVLALPCTSLPCPVRQWLDQLHGSWPTDDMKRYIANSPCFVVPVGFKGSVNEELEWRMSTSLAERCLMFSLNVTQLQVYVLMKMLLKTVINYNVPEENHVSSFMCKTVLLHCVQNTDQADWQTHRLIPCLVFCLSKLYFCVMNENCPHIIIISNNLMAGRFTRQSKYLIHENFQFLFNDFISNGIMSLHFDNTAIKMVLKLNRRMLGLPCTHNDKECQAVCLQLLFDYAHIVQAQLNDTAYEWRNKSSNEQITVLKQAFRYLDQINRHGSSFESLAAKMLVPYLCTHVGSLLASSSIQSSNTVSHEALMFFSLGQNSDIASGRLKLASALYSIGDMNRVELILRDVENRYDFNTCESVCECYTFLKKSLPTRKEAFATADVLDLPRMTSSCVRFTPNETNCIPREFQYEMYRSTPEDLPHRGKNDYWMDWAVVDSLPYLYFLQYKVNRTLQRPADQQQALNNLILTIEKEPNLGHRETALNLLGQCMEQENRWNDAFHCYCLSLNIRPRNNAAKWHVCRLLCMLIQHRVP